MDLVGKFFSDLIFGWHNMASIGDFGVKKLPHFYTGAQNKGYKI